MRFVLQLKRDENDSKDFIRLRVESGFHKTFVQDSWTQCLSDQKFLRREKGEKEWVHLWRKQGQNELNRNHPKMS